MEEAEIAPRIGFQGRSARQTCSPEVESPTRLHCDPTPSLQWAGRCDWATRQSGSLIPALCLAPGSPEDLDTPPPRERPTPRLHASARPFDPIPRSISRATARGPARANQIRLCAQFHLGRARGGRAGRVLCRGVGVPNHSRRASPSGAPSPRVPAAGRTPGTPRGPLRKRRRGGPHPDVHPGPRSLGSPSAGARGAPAVRVAGGGERGREWVE